MSGWRSSQWPENAFAPPKPTGPTMSGGFPPAISVASVSNACWYSTNSPTSCTSVWEALNSWMTFFSTLTCFGSFPVPRQQYQRTSFTPGATDSGATMRGVGAGVPDASGDASSDGAAPVASAVGCWDAGPAAVEDGAAALGAAAVGPAALGAPVVVDVLATGALLVFGALVGAEVPEQAASRMKTVAKTSSRGHGLFIVLLLVWWTRWQRLSRLAWSTSLPAIAGADGDWRGRCARRNSASGRCAQKCAKTRPGLRFRRTPFPRQKVPACVA